MGTPDPPSSRGTMRPFYFLVFDALLSRKRTRFGTLRETLGRNTRDSETASLRHRPRAFVRNADDPEGIISKTLQ